MLVNLINISYCAMKILPYQGETYKEFRFALSEQIQQQVFFVSFVKNIETHIKSNIIVNTLKQPIQQQGYHL